MGSAGKKPMIGKLAVVERLRPGVVNVSWSFGHWAYGSRDVSIDGSIIKGEASRESGLCPNAAMTLNGTLENTTIEDLIGGSAVFYDSFVRLKKV